jgi:hypothetical protein
VWTAILAAASLGSTGCLAHVREERDFGAARPAPGSEVHALQESRPADVRIEASANGGSLDVRVTQATECRTVTVTTSTVREVDIRRSYTDPRPQAWDLAAALLLGGGAAFMAYNADGPWACNSGSSTCDGSVGTASKPAAIGLAALAAVPLAFVVYNAAQVQDDRRLELAGPTQDAGEWHDCSSTPRATEQVTVVMGTSTVHGTTNEDGRVSFDLSPLTLAGGGTAIVRHAGSTDVSVDVAPAERHLP